MSCCASEAPEKKPEGLAKKMVNEISRASSCCGGDQNVKKRGVKALLWTSVLVIAALVTLYAIVH